MHIIDMKCANCAYWESRNGIKGFCPELTDSAMMLLEMPKGSLTMCETVAAGRCDRFEASHEAKQEAHDEAAHMADMRRGAGTDYPASLR